MLEPAPVFIDKKFVDAKVIASFYSISIKTARNRISEMRNDRKFMNSEYYRMSGRVWFPAFDCFIRQKKGDFKR